MASDSCSPLCGADRAYGPRVKWWHHDLLCPARERQYEDYLQATSLDMTKPQRIPPLRPE